MSISSEITRISGNVSAALTAIENKGVTVPQGSTSDDLATLIGLIQTGGGETAHTIYFEFSDGTDTTIAGYWDSSFISDAIRATTPSAYGGKTVTLAELDGVAWYEPAAIPLNTQLIDFTAVKNDYIINASGSEEYYQWTSVSDYTRIDPSMTFVYKGYQWFYIGFYDSSKQPIRTIYIANDYDSHDGEIATGTLTPAKIPSNAVYVRIDSLYNPDASELSLIRTA